MAIGLEVEQFPQPSGLRAAYWNLRLLLVVHAQLVGALEPGHDFADVIDVDQKRAMRAPENIRIEIVEKLLQRPAVRLPFQARMAAGGHRYHAIFDGRITNIFRIAHEHSSL